MRLNPFSLGRLKIQRLLVARMLSLLPGLRPNKNDGCAFALRLDCCPQVDTILHTLRLLVWCRIMFRASCDALASDESHARVIVEGRAQIRHGVVGVVAVGLVTPTGPRGDTYQWLMLLAGKSLWRTCTPRPWATRRCMGIVVYPARLVAGWVAYVRRCVAVPWEFVGG